MDKRYQYNVRYETNALYQQALQQLLDKGINLQSIICDGRRGLLDLFPHTPTQMCQFHQIKIVKRYLTNNPKSPAAKDLHQLVLTLTNSTEKQFQTAFNGWFEQHKNYLNDGTCLICLHLSVSLVWRYPIPPIYWKADLRV